MTYERAAIMRDAHKRCRDGKRLGLAWTFGQCLSMAWRAAKGRRIARRKAIYEELHPETKSSQNASNERKTTDNLSFVSNSAHATGKDRRTIERAFLALHELRA